MLYIQYVKELYCFSFNIFIFLFTIQKKVNKHLKQIISHARVKIAAGLFFKAGPFRSVLKVLFFSVTPINRNVPQ